MIDAHKLIGELIEQSNAYQSRVGKSVEEHKFALLMHPKTWHEMISGDQLHLQGIVDAHNNQLLGMAVIRTTDVAYGHVLWVMTKEHPWMAPAPKPPSDYHPGGIVSGGGGSGGEWTPHLYFIGDKVFPGTYTVTTTAASANTGAVGEGAAGATGIFQQAQPYHMTNADLQDAIKDWPPNKVEKGGWVPPLTPEQLENIIDPNPFTSKPKKKKS